MDGGRPVGTDGYDFAYRMTIEDRYKRAAEGRVALRRLVSVQALLQILKATWACLGALNGDTPNIELVTSCAFGGAAVLLGTLGIKGGAKLLRFYILLTMIAVVLSLVPFASGNYIGKWKDNWEYLQVTGDYQRILYLSLEGLLELIGILLQLVAVLTAFSFMKNVTHRKKRD
ncbi:uncharacterized protein [Physcomitrium patens]|uniref:Transmembrane protein n=1 Tax=Physcomitrium patens TaxID=3218 RepID=A0A2K1KWB5_PHYPA|nr:uncharacterized protein LOC112280708 [Physcomitrium patens]PNR58087.1 hypothetical protein PHYPA_005082 [Physcomitrium patens]|eukprot:XP_024372299.1 uncharacterized protein LOC112280708 [Physcomitrella patens]